ncbi:MAG: hypothetical protein OXI69_06060 [Acidobacteriota bacterium]|nr:hypothetical protein [Acidobacteriota bacterium]
MKAQLGLAFLGSVFLLVLCHSHQGQTVPTISPSFSTATNSAGRSGLSADQRAKMNSRRVRDAFQKLKSDSEKLAEGSAQLKEMVQNSSPHTYSIGIFKKAEELEKLARKIKKRVKRGFP